MLPLRAAYPLGELARAASMDYRTLRLLLVSSGVKLHPVGRITFFFITELRDKPLPPWEAIGTVQRLADHEDPLATRRQSRQSRHSRHSRRFKQKKGGSS